MTQIQIYKDLTQKFCEEIVNHKILPLQLETFCMNNISVVSLIFDS